MKYLLLLLTCLPAAADWQRIQSENFTVVSNAGAKKGREVAKQFEQVRLVFATQFPQLRLSSGKEMVIFAAKDEKSFNQLIPSSYGEYKGKGVAGVFFEDTYRHYVIVRTDFGDQSQPVIYHEYAHLIFRLNFDFLPLWLNEGLAEYFAQIKVLKNEVRLGTVPEYRVRTLNESHYLPIDQLADADESSPLYNEGARASIFYAQSWLLVHYAYSSKEKYFSQLMTLLAKGVSSKQAIQQVFGDSTDLLGKLKTYIRKNRYPVFKIKTQIKIEPGTFPVQDLSDPSFKALVAAMRGELDSGEAEAMAPLSGQSGEAEVALNLGIAYANMSRNEEAVSHLRRAAQDPSTGYLPHYLLGGLCENLDEARTHLKRALLIEPDFAGNFLAMANLTPAGDEKLRYLAKAVSLEPGNFKIRDSYSRRLLESRNYDQALAEAQTALRLAPNQVIRETLTEQVIKPALAGRDLQAEEGEPPARTGAAGVVPPAGIQRNPHGQNRDGVITIVPGGNMEDGFQETLQPFNRGEAYQDPLLKALWEKDRAQAKQLLAQGKGLKARSFFNETALHLAAELGDATLVKALAGAGMDLEAADKGGYTPLLLAAWAGHQDVVDILLKAGADREAANHRGSRALMLAALAGHGDMVKSLIVGKCERNAADRDTYTALDYLNHLKHKDLYRLMRDLKLEHGPKGVLKHTRTEITTDRQRAMEEAGKAPGQADYNVGGTLQDKGGFSFSSKPVARLYRDAALLVTEDKFEKALPLLQKAKNLDPNCEGCSDLLVHVYVLRAETDQALEELTHYSRLSQNPTNLAERNFEVARLILRQPLDGKTGQAAEKCLRAATRLNGAAVPKAYFFLGELYFRFGANDAALEALQAYKATGDGSNYSVVADQYINTIKTAKKK